MKNINNSFTWNNAHILKSHMREDRHLVVLLGDQTIIECNTRFIRPCTEDVKLALLAAKAGTAIKFRTDRNSLSKHLVEFYEITLESTTEDFIDENHHAWIWSKEERSHVNKYTNKYQEWIEFRYRIEIPQKFPHDKEFYSNQRYDLYMRDMGDSDLYIEKSPVVVYRKYLDDSIGFTRSNGSSECSHPNSDMAFKLIVDDLNQKYKKFFSVSI